MIDAYGASTGTRKVAIYIRVSTAEQKVEGYSVEAQRKKLLDYVNNNKALDLCTRKEWIFEDTHTGSDLNRPELQKMLRAVREKKFDAILVFKIDRLSRNLKHLLHIFEELKDHDASFISVQENIDFRGPIGQLIFQVFGAIAQFERELIKDRTRMGKIASAEMGNYTGHTIPYGYKPIKNSSGKGKKLVIIPKEKRWVEEIFRWYIYEGLGFGQIAKKLNELKVPKGRHTRLEKDQFSPWTSKSVGSIIENSIYRGEYVANNKDEEGNLLLEDKWTIVKIPACVSELTFQQAQQIRKNRKGGKVNTAYLLSGKLRDMTLDKPKAFVGAKRHKGGFSYRRKQFKEKDGTHVPVFEIPGKQMEEFVWSKIMEAMQNPQVFIEHYLSKEYSDPSKIRRLENELDHLREQIANAQIGLARIEEAYENGKYDEDTMSRRLSLKNQKIVEMEIKAQEIEDELSFISSVDVEVEKLKNASAQVKYRLENLSNKQKKILCNLFVDRIEMYRERVGKKWSVRAEIFFQFNPQKFPNTLTKDRTTKDLNKRTKGQLKKKSISDGAQERT